MAVSPKREIELIAAAMVLDNDRGDGKFTYVHTLGYANVQGNPAVMTAAQMLHDLCKAGNDPIKVFSKQIAEYHRMENDGGLVLHRAAIQDTEVSRNAPCPCGSGVKYKKCCYWKQGIPEEEEQSKAGRLLTKMITALAALVADDDKPRLKN